MIALQLLLTQEVALPDAGWSRGNRQAAMPQMAGGFVPTVLQERPVFDPSRTAQAKSDAAVDLPLGGAVVAGVVTVRGRSHVIVQPAQGSPVKLAVGGYFRGWRLRSISADGAQFVKGGTPLRVALGGTPAQPQPEEPSEEEGQ